MSDSYIWYQMLIRPSWAPPSWLFGPVWTVLYVLIAFSFGTVFYLGIKKRIPFRVVAPFFINLIANAIFTPLQFGLRSNILASIDILLVLGTLIHAMIRVYPYRRWITYIQIPYLLWVMSHSFRKYPTVHVNYGHDESNIHNSCLGTP